MKNKSPLKNNHISADVPPARGLWLLTGSPDMSLQALSPKLGAGLKILYVGDAQPAAMRSIKASQAKTILGQEHQLIIYDCHSGFDPDALGAVVGTLCAGGLLVLLTPPLVQWPDFVDPNTQRIAVYPHTPAAISRRYLRRLARMMSAHDWIQVFAPTDSLPDLNLHAPVTVVSAGECITQDQSDAVAAIVHVVTGHRRRPLVITADRGRGKSAALGIAAAQLMQQACKNIVLTAPGLAACESVFRHAHAVLPDAVLSHGKLQWQDACLHFIAPDELMAQTTQADLLMVDEAAAIPAAMLEQMLVQHSRVVFSSTVHGYEGTGRGFALRFEKTLSRITPAWHKIQLHSPIRWPQGDLLEAFIFDALLLNAEPVDDKKIIAADSAACCIERLNRDALLENETDLKQLFGLLVLAHYRTRPLDVWQILDGPNLNVYVMRYQGHIVATALLAYEGGFDKAMADEIYHARRRPRGHLLAQSLTTHSAIPAAACLHYARIMRIAVHPALQRRGCGQTLVRAMIDDVRDKNCDAIGTSYSMSDEVFSFWQTLGFKSARIGLSREHTSGSHSLMMLQPLTAAGGEICNLAEQRLVDSLPLLLSERLAELPVAHVVMILSASKQIVPSLIENEWRELESFSFGAGGYDINIVVLNRWTFFLLQHHAQDLSAAQQSLLVLKILQRRSWSGVVLLLGLKSKAEAEQQLRQLVAWSLAEFGDVNAGPC